MSAREQLRELVAKALASDYLAMNEVVFPRDERQAGLVLDTLLENRSLLLSVLAPKPEEIGGEHQGRMLGLEKSWAVYRFTEKPDEKCPECDGRGYGPSQDEETLAVTTCLSCKGTGKKP